MPAAPVLVITGSMRTVLGWPVLRRESQSIGSNSTINMACLPSGPQNVEDAGNVSKLRGKTKQEILDKEDTKLAEKRVKVL